MVSGLGLVGEDLAHRVGGAFGRCIVVMSVPLEGESGGGVPGEGLEIPYGLTTLSEERQAAMPEVVKSDRGKARPFE